MLKLLPTAAFLFFFPGGLALAQEKPSPEFEAAEKRLLAAAETSKDAFLSVHSTRVGLAEDDLITHRGFFINAAGLAVLPLQAFDHGQFDAVLEADQSPVQIAGVVAADLATALAIVRTDHQPVKWLSLQSTDLEVGDRVSIYRAENDGGSVTAPILARRKVAHARSRTYNEVFSLGINLGEFGVTQVPAGTPVLDEGGQVAGILAAPYVTSQQRFHFAFPASVIRAQLPQDAGNSATIPLPLPKSLQPADPLALDATYLLGRRAQLTGNHLDAERLLRKALARQPDSAAGWERLGFVLRDLKRDEDALAAIDKAAEVGKGLAGFVLSRADQLRLMNRLDEATEALRAATISIPHDQELHRALAVALQIKDDKSGAEECLRTATQLAPDVIQNWELLSKCLAAQGKWDEEKVASDKIHELDSLYRPR